MKTKHVWLVALLVIAMILAGGCKLKKGGGQSKTGANVSGNQEENQNQEQNNEGVNLGNVTGSYSINELFTMNRPLKCTWKESLKEGVEVTNILYISGLKFYQDVTMGDIGHAYTINDGEYLYMWNDFSGAATKFKNAEVKSGEQPKEKAKDNAGLEQERAFICESWAVDNSLFIPPAGKDFKDMTEEMTQAFEQIKDIDVDKTKQQICDLCQGAPNEETKQECLKNAQCSE